MSSPISPIRGISLPDSVRQQQPSSKTGSEFGEALSKVMSEVESSRQAATQKVQNYLSGKPEELHTVVLSAQRAQLEFELFLEVRNKVVQAYQEIMRMQV